METGVSKKTLMEKKNWGVHEERKGEKQKEKRKKEELVYVKEMNYLLVVIIQRFDFGAQILEMGWTG